MKRFVFSFRVEPPHLQTVTAKSGGSVFFAAYSRTLDRWYHVTGSSLERIPAPEMLFLDEDYAREHPSKHSPRSYVTLSSRQKKRAVQLSLF